MYVLSTVPTVGAIFKDRALREQGFVETVWTAHVTESTEDLSTALKTGRQIPRSIHLVAAQSKAHKLVPWLSNSATY